MNDHIPVLVGEAITIIFLFASLSFATFVASTTEFGCIESGGIKISAAVIEAIIVVIVELRSVIPCTGVSVGVTRWGIALEFKCGVEIIASGVRNVITSAKVFEVVLVISIVGGPACWNFADVRLVVGAAAIDDILGIAVASTIARTAGLGGIEGKVTVGIYCRGHSSHTITITWVLLEPIALKPL